MLSHFPLGGRIHTTVRLLPFLEVERGVPPQNPVWCAILAGVLINKTESLPVKEKFLGGLKALFLGR